MMENRDLLLDLVEWVGQGPKAYADVMARGAPLAHVYRSGWTRSITGFLARHHVEPDGSIVEVTDKGVQFLKTNGRG